MHADIPRHYRARGPAKKRRRKKSLTRCTQTLAWRVRTPVLLASPSCVASALYVYVYIYVYMWIYICVYV